MKKNKHDDGPLPKLERLDKLELQVKKLRVLMNRVIDKLEERK